MITAHKNNHIKRIPADKKLNIALDAANKAFDADDEDVLFYIPVTKSFIQQAVVSLRLICESSYRNIMFYVATMYNYHVSLGTVFNILDEAADKAPPINQSYDLSLIKDSASDELFHWGSPVLATVDIHSRFCALLVKEDCRDYETWGVHQPAIISCPSKQSGQSVMPQDMSSIALRAMRHHASWSHCSVCNMKK